MPGSAEATAPTATVSPADREDASFAVSFVADTLSDEQLAAYGNWTVDLVLTVNRELTMNISSEEIYPYLSIYCPLLLEYDGWVDMPGGEEDVIIPANTPSTEIPIRCIPICIKPRNC